MRRQLREVVTFALLPWPIIAVPVAGQTASGDLTQAQGLESAVPTFRIAAHEVLVDLVALDRHNRSVLDLTPDELDVAEAPDPGPKKKHIRVPQVAIAPLPANPITSLSIFDPNNPTATRQNAGTSFRILASCLERSTVHYLLAFRPGPSGRTPGFHQISITSRRPSIKLVYRHRYYVGVAAPPPHSPTLRQEQIDRILQQSACSYPVSPLSIILRARVIDTGRTDVVRYLVSVDASSLSFLTLKGDSTGRMPAGLDRSVALDYAVCNFDESGKPASYFHAPLETALTSADYARALDRGFPHILEFPASAHHALTRVVLRDRATGNMGAADVTFPQGNHLPLGRELIGSFGSVIPASDSFCGDVYELPQTSDRLPDFHDLDPIGAVYTSALDVPNQVFWNTTGIPGVTPRTNLFGIDYNASFWVRNAGEYGFRMASDDGAILQIDDQTIIDLDGLHQVNERSAHVQLEAGLHTIHVPYYQGAPVSVALQLWVRPPGADDWVLFDLKRFQGPATVPASK